MGEKDFLVQEARPSIWHNLLMYQKDRYWMFAIWALEVFWLLFVVMANVMELWGSCPWELGLAPVCQYCFSTRFLAWNGIYVTLAFLNLYVYILLRSRGFQLYGRTVAYVYDYNTSKGIPDNAISFFLLLTGGIFIMMLVGIVFLVQSNGCATDRNIYEFRINRNRSELMFWTTAVSLILAPLTFMLGRCMDITTCCAATFDIDESDD